MTIYIEKKLCEYFSRLCSPEKCIRGDLSMGECVAPSPAPPSSPPGPRDPNLVLYVPEMEEIRISPVVARKGYLNVLEHKTHGWKKRWVVRFVF